MNNQQEQASPQEESKATGVVHDAEPVATSSASPRPSRGVGSSASSTGQASAVRARPTAMDMVAKATFRPSIHPDSQSVAGAAVDRIQRALDAEDGEVTLPAGVQRASELGSPPKPPVDVVHEADGDSEGGES
jgi:hypothetical protein